MISVQRPTSLYQPSGLLTGLVPVIKPAFATDAAAPALWQATAPVFNMPSILRASSAAAATDAGAEVKGVAGRSRSDGPSRADRTLLILGDEGDWDSFKKFRRQLYRCDPARLLAASATYAQFDAGELPPIETESVIVFPFFPFAYWDSHIESGASEAVYGNVDFYNKFRALWDGMNARFSERFGDKKLYFMNHPLRIPVDRDKELTKSMLANAGIEVPSPIFTRNHEDILNLVNNQGKKLYLKVRYGSMGKGITRMEKGRWQTNFRFEEGRIVSMRSDHGWTFIDITDNVEFLKELLTKDIVVEEAVESPIIDGSKFDLRFYVCLGSVLYIYARTNDPDAVTTNISQGGKGRDPRFLKKLPPGTLKKAARLAVRANEVIGLEFAGVDIMLGADMKSASVIELNAFPGFPPMQSYPRFNLSRRIIKMIEKHRFQGA